MSRKTILIVLTLFFLLVSIMTHLILGQKAEGYKQRGLWLYGHADHPSEAEDDLLRSVSLNPFSSESYFYLGLIYSEDGSKDDESALRMFWYATWTDWNNCLYHAKYLDKILELEKYSILETATKRAAKCEFSQFYNVNEYYGYWANMTHALYVLLDYESAILAYTRVIAQREVVGDDRMTAEPFLFYGLALEKTDGPRELICVTYQYAEVFYSPELGDLAEWLPEIESKIELFCAETTQA